MKICIVSLYKSNNLGEVAYTECVRKMIEHRIPGVEIVFADILGRDADNPYKDSFITKVLRKMHLFKIEKKLCFSKENAFLERYFEKKISGTDAVIIPGGGYIKCTPRSPYDRSYRYNDYFSIMADRCESEGIGLYFNAVGHTINQNEEHENNVWKEVFSKPSIRYLSCRDELEFFKRARLDARLVCCSAAYAADLFGMRRNKASKTIGIGIIRPDAFTDYGYQISVDQLVSFYISLIEKLVNQGYEVKLFTNGLERDYAFAQIIEKASGICELYDRPTTLETLLEMISSFASVIVSRMHAAIIAYSFDIPAVCLAWNNKHLGFMKCAGVAERAIYPKQFFAEHVASIIFRAMDEGWPEEQKVSYRKTAFSSVDIILDDIVKMRGNTVLNLKDLESC